MKKRAKRLTIIGVVLTMGLMAFMTIGGFAANPQGIGVSARVAPTISVNCPSGTDINWGGTDLAPGLHTDSVDFVVNSNKLWYMTVTTNQDLTSGSNVIPNGELTYTVAGGAGINSPQSTASTFNTSGTNVCGNPSSCDRGSGMSLTVTYALNLGWDVEPTGPTDPAYTATHTYTATQI